MSAYRYMLDTNIVSDLVRDPHGAVAHQIAKVGEELVCTSVVVACELRFGAAKKGSARLSQQVEAILSALPILPLESGVDTHYGRLRAMLEKAGLPIGANDLLIAAHALHSELTLVTDNTSEFERVSGLKLRNWLAKRKM